MIALLFSHSIVIPITPCAVLLSWGRVGKQHCGRRILRPYVNWLYWIPDLSRPVPRCKRTEGVVVPGREGVWRNTHVPTKKCINVQQVPRSNIPRQPRRRSVMWLFRSVTQVFLTRCRDSSNQCTSGVGGRIGRFASCLRSLVGGSLRR